MIMPETNVQQHQVVEAAGRRKEIVGEVVSNRMQKTIVVEVVRKRAHPFYGRVVSKAKKFYAHDEKNQAHVGDLVRRQRAHQALQVSGHEGKRYGSVRWQNAAPGADAYRVATVPAPKSPDRRARTRCTAPRSMAPTQPRPHLDTTVHIWSISCWAPASLGSAAPNPGTPRSITIPPPRP